MRQIELHSRKRPGIFALVDDEDFEVVSPYYWGVLLPAKSNTMYAYANATGIPGSILMHRIVLGAGKGQIVDHIDMYGLNNTRSNLRIVTRQENNRHVGTRSHNTSGRKGVGWDKSKNKWRSQITVDGKNVFLGRYDDLEEAARAYDRAALECFGEFAVINFPETMLNS